MGLHGVCMIAAYGVLIQIAEIIANHTAYETSMKTKYFNKDSGGHPDGYKRFNIHRTLGGAALICAIVGVIAIFVGYGTKVFDYGRHAIYGLIMIGITIIQISLRVCLPAVDPVFHRWLGRFICFWAFWCMYTGKEADLTQDGKNTEVEGKYWLTYVLFVIFYSIRLYYLAKRCNNKDVVHRELEDDNDNHSKTVTDVELKSNTAAPV